LLFFFANLVFLKSQRIYYPDAIDADVNVIDIRYMAFYDKDLKAGQTFDWPSLERFDDELDPGDSRLDSVIVAVRVGQNYEVDPYVLLRSGQNWHEAMRGNTNYLNPIAERSSAPTPLYMRDSGRNDMTSLDCYAV
jgi:hypothetical protein